MDQLFDTGGQGLGCVSMSTRLGGFGRADQQGDFAFCGMIAEGLHEVKELAAAKFFVEFSDFAGQAGRAISKNGQGIGDRIGDAMRRFVEDDGALFNAQMLKGATALATARGKKSYKKKFLIGQTGGGKSGKQRGRARDRHDRDVVANGESDEAMAGVGDERHACIADERDGRAVFHGQDEFGSAGDLVVFVVADQRLADVVMIQELQGVASIFAGDLIHFFQDAQGAEGDVLQIADWRRYQVEAAMRCGIGMGAFGHGMC